jgi:hypothetical protein
MKKVSRKPCESGRHMTAPKHAYGSLEDDPVSSDAQQTIFSLPSMFCFGWLKRTSLSLFYSHSTSLLNYITPSLALFTFLHPSLL